MEFFPSPFLLSIIIVLQFFFDIIFPSKFLNIISHLNSFKSTSLLIDNKPSNSINWFFFYFNIYYFI